MNKRKLLAKATRSPQNLRFTELQLLAEAFGYRLDHINGSHHCYEYPDRSLVLNIQPLNGGKAKAYQVRQLLKLADKYGLSLTGKEHS